MDIHVFLQGDYFAVYLKDGRVGVQYNLGGGQAEILSDDRYSTGEWTYVRVSRTGQTGELFICNLRCPNTPLFLDSCITI